VEGHCSRLQKIEDRLSGLKDKLDIKEKKQKNFNSNNSRALKEYA
jgi:hypothetical protein